MYVRWLFNRFQGSFMKQTTLPGQQQLRQQQQLYFTSKLQLLKLILGELEKSDLPEI